jgi:serine/threonine protein phosphatase PrpC
LRLALLRGRDHLELGVVDAVGEGCGALAITLGGAPKRYPHVDPNEDAALLVLGPAGVLAAVADGHHGFEAAEVALEYLATHPGPHWVEPGTVREATWRRQAAAVLEDANRAIRAERAEQEAGARTTLAFALVLPGQGTILHAAVGDSHLYRVAADGTVADLAAAGDRKPFFLGQGAADAASLAAQGSIGAAPLAGARALVLATDGLTQPGIGVDDPERAVREAIDASASASPALRPLAAARCLVERACAAHRAGRSGDNAACAVVWLGE